MNKESLPDRQSTTISRKKGESGFSLIEMLIVLALISVMATFSLFNYEPHAKLHKPDHQTQMIVDILQTARQQALTKRRIMRVEVNQTLRTVRLIDENRSGTSNDDEEIKSLKLADIGEIRIDRRPENIASNDAPPESAPCPEAQFISSVHPSSAGNLVSTLRFKGNGEVVDAGINDIGANASIRGTTLYVWPPDSNDPNKIKDLGLARAITIVGTGAVRVWSHSSQPKDGVKGTSWITLR